MKNLYRFLGIILIIPILTAIIFHDKPTETSSQWAVRALFAFASAVVGSGLLFGFEGFKGKYISFGDFTNPNSIKMSSTFFCFIFGLLIQFVCLTLIF